MPEIGDLSDRDTAVYDRSTPPPRRIAEATIFATRVVTSRLGGENKPPTPLSLADWTVRRSWTQTAVVAGDGTIVEATAGLGDYLAEGFASPICQTASSQTASSQTASSQTASSQTASSQTASPPDRAAPGDTPRLCRVVLPALLDAVTASLEQSRRSGQTCERIVEIDAPAACADAAWRQSDRWRVIVQAEPYPAAAGDRTTAVLLRRQPISPDQPPDQPLNRAPGRTPEPAADQPPQRGSREPRLAMAMAAASIGSFEYQSDGGGFELDEPSRRLMNLPADSEVDPASFFGAIVPADRTAVRRAIARTVEQGKPYLTEFRVLDDLGRTRWLAGRGQVIAASDDRPARLIGVHWDVTTAKHLESHPRFLAKLQHRLDTFKTSGELMAEATRQIANYMRVDSCSVVRTDPIAELATVLAQHSDDGSHWTGSYPLDDLYPPAAIAAIRRDAPIVVERCRIEDPSDFDGAPAIGAILDGGPAVPGSQRFSIVCVSRQPRVWRSDERRLLHDLTAVLHLRLQRAWVEERLVGERGRLAVANAKLETANSKLQALFEQAHYFQVILDREGSVTDINDVTLRTFGLTRRSTIGQPFWTIRPWSDHLGGGSDPWGWRTDHLAAPLAGQTHAAELTHRGVGGQIRQIELTYTPARGGDGEVAFIVATGSDITARHQQDEQIRIGQQRLRIAFTAAELQLWQIDLTTGQWSTGGRATDGSRVDAMKTRGGLEEFLMRIHRCDRNAVAAALKRSIETGRPFRAEYRVRHGKTFRWMLSVAHRNLARETWPVAAAAVTDSPTSPHAGMLMVGAEMDITKRKASELDLKLSVERLHAAAQTAGFGTFYVDQRSDQLIQSVELQNLLGTDAPPAKFNWSQMPYTVHPEDQPLADEHFRTQVLQHVRAEPIEHRILRGDGEVRWVQLQTKTSFAGRGTRRQAVSVIGTLLDITQRREVETSLDAARQMAESANRSKSEFLANMSHEIRTPMTAILGYVDLLAGNPPGPAASHTEQADWDQNASHLQTIRDNGQFLLTIINDILDLSKIEAGKLEIVPEPIAPHQLIEDVRSIMEVRAREQQLPLRVDYRGRIPERIQTDPKRLKQILINLLSNAIKFSEAGEVRLRVRFDDSGDGQMNFAVIDQGIGMTPSQQSRLFRPFTQADASVSRTFGGTGLGLAISQRLAQMLGGSISVQSEPGRGSTFAVTIDPGDVDGVALIEPSLSLKRPVPTPEAPAPPLSGRILVVDDHRDIRFLSRRILQKAGAAVSEAQDGQEAVEQVQAMINNGHVVDLIVLDMQMPRLDGYRTAKQLRKMGYAGGILALTADAMQGDMTKCLASGCNAYLSKPIDSAQLLKLAAEHMP